MKLKKKTCILIPKDASRSSVAISNLQAMKFKTYQICHYIQKTNDIVYQINSWIKSSSWPQILARLPSLTLLIISAVGDWILRKLVIIYSIAPIWQMNDQFSWTLFQQLRKKFNFLWRYYYQTSLLCWRIVRLSD